MDSVEAVTVSVEPVTESLEPVTGSVEPVTESLEAVTGSLEAVTGSVEPVTVSVEPVTVSVEPVTVSVEPVTESVEAVTDSVEPVTDSVEPVTDSVEPVTDSVEAVSVSVEAVTDSVEPVSDSVEAVTDSVEAVTVSVERVTDSVEPVTDSVKPVTDSVEKILNYRFTNKTLLKNTLKQGSSSFNRSKFVGEAALVLAITNHIYLAHPTLEPMELNLLRNAIRSNEKYASVVAKHNIHQFFIRNVVSQGQEKIKRFTELVGKEDNPILYGGFVKAPRILVDLIESLAGAVYIDVNYDIKRLWEIFKPLFEPIYTLDDLRRQPQPVVTLFHWADKHGKRIEIKYSECSDFKGTIAQVYLDDKFLAHGKPHRLKDFAKLTAAKKAIHELLKKGFTVEMVMGEDRLDVDIEDAKEKLIEICNKRKWPNPIYSVEKKVGRGGYVCSATIETPTEEGTLCIMGNRRTRRKTAENSSATHMIRVLTRPGHMGNGSGFG